LGGRTLRKEGILVLSDRPELALYPEHGFARITRVSNYFLIHYAMSDAKRDKTIFVELQNADLRSHLLAFQAVPIDVLTR